MQQKCSGIDYTALNRALVQGLKARRVSPHCWMVTSSDATREYEVVVNGVVQCQCQAGLEGKSCKHAALAQVLAATTDMPIQRRPGDGFYGIAEPDGDVVPDDLVNDVAAGSRFYWAEP